MITIDAESRQNILSPTDLSKKSEKYITENGLFTVPSPSLETVEKNIFYLLSNSVKKSFDKKYIMKPSYLSFDEYGTPILDYLLMYLNGIYCIEDFDLITITIPSLHAIIRINEDNMTSYDKTANKVLLW